MKRTVRIVAGCILTAIALVVLVGAAAHGAHARPRPGVTVSTTPEPSYGIDPDALYATQGP